MSTKINARSPYFITINEPVESLPEFVCQDPLNGANPFGFSVDSNGNITLPQLQRGQISNQSADSFPALAPGASSVPRVLTLTIQIPENFSNTPDRSISCNVSFTQTAPSVPTNNCPSTNGTIPNQTLTKESTATTLNISSYFTAGSSPINRYSVNNNRPDFVTTSISGSTLSMTPSTVCATHSITVSAHYDADNCSVSQSISITIGGCTTWTDDLQGGSIDQDGTINDPSTTAVPITERRLSSGGANVTSVAPNNTANSITIPMWFLVTVPDGYTNAGSLEVSHPLVQAGTTLKTVICSGETFSGPSITPQFTGWRITTSGSVDVGNAFVNGVPATVTAYTTPIPRNTSTSTVARTLQIAFTVPDGYANSGATKVCSHVVNQDAAELVCGTHGLALTQPAGTPGDLCSNAFTAGNVVTCFVEDVGTALIGTRICSGGTPFNGGNNYYGFSDYVVSPLTGVGKTFFYGQISTTGYVLNLSQKTCASSTDDGEGVQY